MYLGLAVYDVNLIRFYITLIMHSKSPNYNCVAEHPRVVRNRGCPQWGGDLGASFDPIWGSFGARGQKLWAKHFFGFYNFHKFLDRKWAWLALGKRPGGPPRRSPKIWTSYVKSFRSYWFYSKWPLWGKVRHLTPSCFQIVMQKNGTVHVMPKGTLPNWEIQSFSSATLGWANSLHSNKFLKSSREGRPETPREHSCQMQTA